MLLNFLNGSSWSPSAHKHGDEGLQSLVSLSESLAGLPVIVILLR